jgi:hypothetical protein
MIHYVNSSSSSAIASTLCNLLGSLCTLLAQNVVLVICLSHLRGTNSKASPLGSLIDFINDSLNLEFIIPLEQLNHVSPLETKKRKTIL